MRFTNLGFSSFALVVFTCLASMGCQPDTLFIDAHENDGAGDHEKVLPVDETGVLQLHLGSSIEVTAFIHHPEIEGFTSLRAETLTSASPSTVAVKCSAGGFTLEARALGETTLRGTADSSAALTGSFTADQVVRVVP
jgi:hypothetical protein